MITKDNLALVLVGEENKTSIKNALKYVGWVELRVDEFLKKGLTPSFSLPVKDVKVIGTARWKKESQNEGLNITEKERFEIYKKLLDYVDYFDVELKSSISEKVVDYFKNKGKKSVLSYHNFVKTPSLKNLDNIYSSAIKLKPDIIKVATTVNSKDELVTLLSFTHKYSKKFPIIVTPMGVSFVERFAPIYLGSLFTYISLSRKTAPGQVSLDYVKKVFSL